jgi:hypothetical protein
VSRPLVTANPGEMFFAWRVLELLPRSGPDDKTSVLALCTKCNKTRRKIPLGGLRAGTASRQCIKCAVRANRNWANRYTGPSSVIPYSRGGE